MQTKRVIIFIVVLAVCAFLILRRSPKPIVLPSAVVSTTKGPYEPPRLPFPNSREYLKHFRTVQYRGTKTGNARIVYKDFYPADLNWKDGGCTWWDKTKLGSPIKVTYGPDWESAKGVPGHTLEYECHWSAPK